MPYALKLGLYLIAAGYITVVIADLYSPLGAALNALLAVALPYLLIVIGRRLLGRKNL
jgi:hypothetical protein